MGKIIGGVLLVAGTTIGGGMLSLPITTAKTGLFYSTLLFIASWALMTFTAFLTLEVNLCFPRNSHMISMAKSTLGKPGAIMTWTIYLFLLYAIIAAYIAGGQDIFLGLLQSLGIKAPAALCGIAFVVIFGSIVIRGVHQVDIVNRFLMIFKLGAILSLIYFIGIHANKTNYIHGNIPFIISAVSITILSFSFSPLIPTLRSYFQDNVKQLRWVIFWGTFIPLLLYIGWNIAIFGSVPVAGSNGLERLMTHHQPITGLLASIHHYVRNDYIETIAKIFTSVCILTAFVSVSLSLSDYLSDGFRITKKGWGKVFILGMTFVPPLLVAIFYPRAFIFFLSFAGLFCMFMFAFMPCLMSWICRYRKNIPMSYRVTGGKFSLVISFILSIIICGLVAYELFVGV